MTISPLPAPRSPGVAVAELLDEFFAEALLTARPVTAQRIDAVRAHLEHHLDLYGWEILENAQLLRLRSQRRGARVGSFARVAFAEDLYYALYLYLQPEFRMPEQIDARCQVKVVADLTQWLWTHGRLQRLSEGSCVVMDVDFALREARRSLTVKAR
jgi:hypothetical protein